MKLTSLRRGAFALALALLLSLWSPALAAEAGAAETGTAAETSALAQSAQTAAEAALQYGGADSVSYALWKDGEIVLTGSAGAYSRTEDRALTDDVLYGVGSISKTYTAVLMMTLVEAGKVDLDQPVTTYLPEFTMADPRYEDITVRMLLNHSSGLMGSAGPSSFLFGDGAHDASDDLLERLSTQTLQADPGAYSVYSNDSYTLAQLVIEAASGMDYGAYLHEAVIEPLGLENTFVPADNVAADRFARTYLNAEDDRALPTETVAALATGGVYASASDLAAFGGALCGEGLLTEASLEAMAADEYLRGMWPEDSEGDALAYGLGWDSVHMFPFNQSGIQALVKGGDTLVYHSGLVVLPDHDMAAAVVSSGGASTFDQAAAARILIDALAEEGVTVDETAALDQAEAAPMPEELTALSGPYGTSTLLYDVDITADGTMTLTVAGVSVPLTYRADGTFRDEANSMLLRLVEEDNGRTYLFQKAYTPLPGLAPTCVAEYVMERLPEHEADQEALAAWYAREGKIYLQTNERYTSSLYPLSGVFAAISFQGVPEGAESYMLTNQIVDANTAVPVLQIPGVGSRDSGTVYIRDVDGVEYIELNGGLYMDASAAPAVYPGDASYCTIQPDGGARWHTVGEAAGKTMTVTVPDNGGFCVYNADMTLAASSWIYGDTEAVLPEGGLIVFAGDPGARFLVSMS